MKLFAFLPFALGIQNSRFPSQYDDFSELKVGDSLCQSDKCPNFNGKESYGNENFGYYNRRHYFDHNL